jgi:hypothetical protein
MSEAIEAVIAGGRSGVATNLLSFVQSPTRLYSAARDRRNDHPCCVRTARQFFFMPGLRQDVLACSVSLRWARSTVRSNDQIRRLMRRRTA